GGFLAHLRLELSRHAQAFDLGRGLTDQIDVELFRGERAIQRTSALVLRLFQRDHLLALLLALRGKGIIAKALAHYRLVAARLLGPVEIADESAADVLDRLCCVAKLRGGSSRSGNDFQN